MQAVQRLLTMHFGPHTILLAMALNCRKDLSAPGLEQTVERLEKKIRTHHHDVKHIFIESESIAPKQRENRT